MDFQQCGRRDSKFVRTGDGRFSGDGDDYGDIEQRGVREHSDYSDAPVTPASPRIP